MNDDVDGDLTPRQRADLRLGEWRKEQRHQHNIEKFLCFVIGAGLGAALSRFFF